VHQRQELLKPDHRAGFQVAKKDEIFKIFSNYVSEILKPLEKNLKNIDQNKPSVILIAGVNGVGKTTTIGKLGKIFSKNKTTFCYCVSEYPLLFEKINWKNALQFDGFSDHTLGVSAPIIYTTLKKYQKAKNIMIEKHIKLKNSNGPDAPSSIDTEEFSKMIKSIRLIENSKLN